MTPKLNNPANCWDYTVMFHFLSRSLHKRVFDFFSGVEGFPYHNPCECNGRDWRFALLNDAFAICK